MMCTEKSKPTVDELFETLKRTSLPTVLVEGKDDIIFYRKIEEDLRSFGVDMLPAGNKDAVLSLYRKLKTCRVRSPMIFVVDNDLWVHRPPANSGELVDIITTDGYSIENDLYIDGSLESLLGADEISIFSTELYKFVRWYARSINKQLNGVDTSFRTHPGKILDDNHFYEKEMTLDEDENYPEELYDEIIKGYPRLLRGKSLFGLLLRQLSSKRREVKFSAKQLMEFGASRKGTNYQRICDSVRSSLEAARDSDLASAA